MKINLRLVALAAICLPFTLGCLQSGDDARIVAPPTVEAIHQDVDAPGDTNNIVAPPFADLGTGELPPDPALVDELDEEIGSRTSSSSEIAEPSTPPAQADDEQFQVQTQIYQLSGQEHQVSMKLDRHTGETWRRDSTTQAWTPVPEANADAAPNPASTARYALLARGSKSPSSPDEIFMRLDLVSGGTWMYTKHQASWKRLGQ